MADASELLSQFYVKLDGNDAAEDFMRDLMEVTVENSLHLPDVATLVLHDPHLRWTDAESLAPGKSVKIAARHAAGEKPIFDGEIVELEPDFHPSTQILTVRAFDRMHRLARGQHMRSFQNVTDGDLVKKLAQEVGLKAHSAPTSQVHPYVFQNNQTNLAFLRDRAAALGYLLYVQGDTLYFEPPTAAGQPIPLEWGATLSEFRPRLTTVGQSGDVTVRGWDPATRQEIVGHAKNGQGAPSVGEKQSGGDLAQGAFHVDAQSQGVIRPVRSQAEADALAQALADQRASRFIEAEGVCAGNPAVVAGSSVQISAVGDRFSGTYFITSATHIYSAQSGYVTQFSVSGLHPATLLSVLQPQHVGGVGAAAAPQHTLGLVIGIVTDNNDPLNQGRVKVKYPALTPDHASDWARVVGMGAGAQRGIEFTPEVNDEVLVGFEMGDIHHPYVMGGLWNGQDAPPYGTADVVRGGKVALRIIQSREGHYIAFLESDDTKGITIVDTSGNTIALNAQEKKLEIRCSGDALMNASGNIVIEAGQNLTLKAPQGQVEIQGSTGAKVESDATVDIKGTLINLN
ncbi:MAG TPA: VgrG-related protein [Ktedonobacterales bacterium]|nr:VgrG-related protein [Ktedonobacterales bacterium]